MTGILMYSKEDHCYAITDRKGRLQKLIRAGQQLYVYLCEVWVPVILQYSANLGNWYFKYLPGIEVAGCKAMINES